MVYSLGCTYSNGSDHKTPTDEIEKIDSTLLGCQFCVLEQEFIKAEITLNRYNSISRELDSCDLVLQKKWKVKYDSLLKKHEQLSEVFNGSVYSAETHCSKRYPFNYIKDTKKRDSLLLLLDIWHNRIHPTLIDTTCYIPEMENGKYKVMFKGEKYLLNEEEYDLSNRIMYKKFNAIESYIEDQKNILFRELSGQTEPDIYFKEILRRYANYISKKYKRDPQTDVSKEILEEYNKLVNEAMKFEY